MKKFTFTSTLILGFLLFSSFTKVIPDTRLVDYLGQEKLAILQKNDPDIIVYYNYFLDNSYIIQTLPADKLKGGNYKTLNLPLSAGQVDRKKLNVLKLDIQRKYDQRVYYKIAGSQEVLIFLSEKEFMKKYNAYRKQ
ncbi:MAG: hypothetical protein DSY76_02720 [Bacteroidetes bacterium]|nr:MAG: hypothetical protein DSY76_02720 [Bacteroidota bacterium]